MFWNDAKVSDTIENRPTKKRCIFCLQKSEEYISLSSKNRTTAKKIGNLLKSAKMFKISSSTTFKKYDNRMSFYRVLRDGKLLLQVGRSVLKKKLKMKFKTNLKTKFKTKIKYKLVCPQTKVKTNFKTKFKTHLQRN